MLGRENSNCKDPEEGGSGASNGSVVRRSEKYIGSGHVVPVRLPGTGTLHPE